RLSDNVVVNWNQVVGLRNQHELTISGVRNDQDLEQTGTAYLRDGFTAPEIFGGNRNNRMPNVLTVDVYSPGGAGLFGNDYPTHIIGNYYLVKDNLTLVRGSHTFKTGLYFN